MKENEMSEVEKLAKTANSFISFVVWCVAIFLFVDIVGGIAMLIYINAH